MERKLATQFSTTRLPHIVRKIEKYHYCCIQHADKKRTNMNNQNRKLEIGMHRREKF